MKFGDFEISVYVILIVVVVGYKTFLIILALTVPESKYKRLKGLVNIHAIINPLSGLIEVLRNGKSEG